MKFNLNKKVLTVTALFGVAVGIAIYFIAHAATVLCAAGAVAPCGGAPLGTTANADTIIANAAGSTIIDQAGNDIIYGSDAADTIPCAAVGDCLGDDFIDMRGAVDIVGGPAGGPACANQANVAGNDFIIGGPESALDGNDTLCGGPGNDYLFGGAGADTLAGNADNDVIVPGTGVDNVCNAAGDGGTCAGIAASGLGDDVVIIYASNVPAGGNELLHCGTGNDVFIFIGFSALPALQVGVGAAVVITDPITGGTYTITNTGANPCVLTN